MSKPGERVQICLSAEVAVELMTYANEHGMSLGSVGRSAVISFLREAKRVSAVMRKHPKGGMPTGCPAERPYLTFKEMTHRDTQMSRWKQLSFAPDDDTVLYPQWNEWEEQGLDDNEMLEAAKELWGEI